MRQLVCSLFLIGFHVACVEEQANSPAGATAPVVGEDSNVAMGTEPTLENSHLATPVVPEAIPAVQNVLDYLYTVPGTGILSGQMESTWKGSPEYEMDYIQANTGQLPAIRGLDFMYFDGVAARADAWWQDGGLPTICWHWGAPGLGEAYDGSLVQNLTLPEGMGFADFIDRVITPGTDTNKLAMVNLSRAASELSWLRDRGVPVLWKPFHEMNGGWFWWGAGGASSFISLWRWMFDYFTNERGLTNLIWVWGTAGGHEAASWYPGDDVVDLVAVDTYDDPRQTGEHQKLYDNMLNLTRPDAPVALHENGRIPDPDRCMENGLDWLFFMTWHTEYLTRDNPPDWLAQVYNHPYVITRDELPNLGQGM